MDISDRIRKRREAREIIDTAKQVQIELQVDTLVIAENGAPMPVASLDPDCLLEIAGKTDDLP